MKSKSVMLLALAALALSIFAGCAQDSTNTTDDNPAMQEEVAKEKAGEPTGPASTNPTREGKAGASGGTKGTKLSLAADPSGALKFNTKKLAANAGAITIALTNESAVPHDVSVRDSGDKVLGESKEVTKGSTDLVIKDVGAGTYTFFCTVPGHEQAGMVGTLTVR